MVMYSSYFMQASRLSRYFRTLWNYIFMGTEFGKGGPILAAKLVRGRPFLAAERFFRYRASITHMGACTRQININRCIQLGLDFYGVLLCMQFVVSWVRARAYISRQLARSMYIRTCRPIVSYVFINNDNNITHSRESPPVYPSSAIKIATSVFSMRVSIQLSPASERPQPDSLYTTVATLLFISLQHSE